MKNDFTSIFCSCQLHNIYYYDNIVRHVCTYLEFINANSNEQTDPEAGKIEDPLG